MRMVHAIQENTTEGAQQVQQTGIGGDAKIVYALLTGMVSDKVVYPVREYATNAWEVSPPGRPPEIQLPTRFEPVFTIRDFGPGLGHSFMMKRYAKIGESTKDGDDDAVGGWGFGSKAALAYLMRSDGAGSFTVTSRHKGFRRVYVIGVSEQGKIQIQFMGEWPLEPEDRGTGLEITFPVRPDDVHRFREHAQAVYWSFEPRPVLTPAIDFGTPKIWHQGDGWTLYDPSTVPFSGPQVQLGPVMYPINMDLAPRCALLTHRPDIIFKAKIGSISVSASREALQYDDRTEAGLKALFDHYETDWLAKARAAVDAETSFFRARWKADEIARTLGPNGWRVVSQIGWHGFNFNDDLFREGGDIRGCLWPEGNHINSAGVLTFKPSWKINPAELVNRKVVIQHNTSRTAERWQLSGLGGVPCIWVRCRKADLPAALERMGNPEYVLLDSFKLPKREWASREKRPESVKKHKLLALDGTRSTDWIDTAEEHLYVDVEGRGRRVTIETRVGDRWRSWAVDSFRNLMRAAVERGLIEADTKIVIRDVDGGTPEHWRRLGDHLAEAIDEVIDPTQVAPSIPWDYASFPMRLRTLADNEGIDCSSAPQELLDLIDGMKNLQSTRQALTREPNEHDKLAALYLKLTGEDLKTVAQNPTTPIIQGWEDFMRQHPLLNLIFEIYDRRVHTYDIDAKKKATQAFKQYFDLVAQAK